MFRPLNVSLDQSTSMREVDGPSFILIYFYVPALTPQLHWSEVAL